MKPIEYAYKLGADQAALDFTKQALSGLGDPMFWQAQQDQAAPEEAAPPPSAEDAALSLPPGIFQGLQMKINPAGERSTTVKVTPDALSTPDTLAGIFQAEPATKVEMALPQPTGPAGGAGGPNGTGAAEGSPVDGAGAVPVPGVPPKLAEWHKWAEKTRIESESNPDVSADYPWRAKKTEAERNAEELLRMKLR
jgi:hypothetical protein